MGKKVPCRQRITRSGDVWYTVKNINIFTIIPYIFGKYFWKDLYCSKSEEAKIHVELNKAADKIKTLLAQLPQVQATLKAELKQVEKETSSSDATGKTFYLDMSEVPKDRTYVPMPEMTWKEVVNTRLSGDKSQGTLRERIGGGQLNNRPRSGTTGFTLDEVNRQFGNHLEDTNDVDQMAGYKPPKPKQKGKNRHGKNRIRGESDEEYEYRLENMKNRSSEYEDDDLLR